MQHDSAMFCPHSFVVDDIYKEMHMDKKVGLYFIPTQVVTICIFGSQLHFMLFQP